MSIFSENKTLAQYSLYNHNDPIHGYQNVRVAKTFAKRAISIIESIRTQHDNIAKEQVGLLAMDNSTCVLSTAVKFKQPEYMFVSGKKDPPSIFEFENLKLLFILDDVLYWGRLVENTIKALDKFTVYDNLPLHLITITGGKPSAWSDFPSRLSSWYKTYYFSANRDWMRPEYIKE